MRQKASIAFLLLCIGVSGAAFYNVLSDNTEVRAQATAVACEKLTPRCGPGGAAISREDRNPFAQTFEFAPSGARITVRCARAAVLVGEYSCVKE